MGSMQDASPDLPYDAGSDPDRRRAKDNDRGICSGCGKKTIVVRQKKMSTVIGKVKNNGGFAGISDDPEDRQLYHAYEKRKGAGRIDFDDMLLSAISCSAVGPDILKKWQERYSYILIDEFRTTAGSV